MIAAALIATARDVDPVATAERLGAGLIVQTPGLIPTKTAADPHSARAVRAEDIARALNGRRCGSGWICKCPAHEDAAPSLSIANGRHGRPVFFCHAGCDWRDVLDALAKGLAPRFNPKWRGRQCR